MPIEAGAVSESEFLGVSFSPLPLADVVAALTGRDADAPFTYVVTPNVDHVIRLDGEPEDSPLARAYQGARLTLCDSRILARLARINGVRLPVVPGSDLTERLFATVVRPGDRLALIGGDAATVADLVMRFGELDIVQHRPPMGLAANPGAMAVAAAFVTDASARFTFLAIGAPQQELLAAAIAARGDATGIGLCVGASIDFLTGRQRRAPRWMQRAGLEWAHRLGSQPRRLWRRYLVEGPRVLPLMLRWRTRRRADGRAT